MLNIINKTISDGQLVMGQPDDYTEHTTEQYRSEFSSGDISSFLRIMRGSVIEATPEQISVVSDSSRIINESLTKMGLNINFTMGMVYTDGSDNCGMPYTKVDSMVMPQGYHFPPGVLSYLNPHLVAHELWHILSRKFPELRDAAYEAIGFVKNLDGKTLEDVSNYHNLGLYDLNSFEQVYFVNPDAIHHHFHFAQGDVKLYPCLIKTSHVVPVLVHVKDDKIIEIEPISQNTDFLLNFSNVSYNTHPEEICAEHFRMFIMGETDLPNPEMMAAFKEVVFKHFND